MINAKTCRGVVIFLNNQGMFGTTDKKLLPRMFWITEHCHHMESLLAYLVATGNQILSQKKMNGSLLNINLSMQLTNSSFNFFTFVTF